MWQMNIRSRPLTLSLSSVTKDGAFRIPSIFDNQLSTQIAHQMILYLFRWYPRKEQLIDYGYEVVP